MITGFYACVLVVLYMQLSLKIVGLRRRHKVSIGDGDIKELQRAIATHSNASQYIPISLLLLLVCELNAANIIFLHLAGVVLVVGRFLHSQSIVKTSFKKRVLGMQLTLFSIVSLSVVNLFIFCKNTLFSFI
ncbi:MAG: MAPEG family protein [Cellvibrionaceae bacterium]